MKRFLCCGILLVLLCLGTAYPDDSGARFQSLSGNVEIRSAADTETWAPGTTTVALNAGDHIRTGGNSTTIIGFADSSTLVMKPESEIAIDHLSSGKTRIRVIDGHLWVNLKAMTGNGSLEVEMESAIAAITGTNITCGSSRNGGIETDTVTTLRGEADVTIRDTGEHFSLGEGQQLTIRGGQVQQQTVDVNTQSTQWNSQLQNMGGGVDMGDIPGILRNIRENEGTLIRNLRSSLEGANRETAPALLKAVDRAIGVLDEDAMTMNNFMRRVRESGTRADQGLVGAIADVLRSNASYRTDVGAMLRQLRQIEALNIGEIPIRLETLRSSLANGFNAISEANAAIPDGTAANAPVIQEFRAKLNEYQQTLAQAEAEVQRIIRQLSDLIAGGQGNVQQVRALARQAAAINDAIAGYRQALRRFSARTFATATPNTEAEQAAAQQIGERLTALAERIAALSDKLGQVREAFDHARNAVGTPGQSQQVYLDARDALNSAVLGMLADVAGDLESLRADVQTCNDQKSTFVNGLGDKLTQSAVLRNAVSDLNRRLTDVSTQLISLSTDLTKFKSEQASLLNSLNVTMIDPSLMTQLQDLEEGMSNSIQTFETTLMSHDDLLKLGDEARLRLSIQILGTFAKVKRSYVNGQRLYESATRAAGRGILTQEMEAIQSTWERISDDYQRIGGDFEARVADLENQFNTMLH